MLDLVLGLDIGGTSSRALVGDLRGRVVGRGSAGGGNPNSHPPRQAVAEVTAAAAAAMNGLEAGSVRRVVLGMAGISKMTDPQVAELFDEGWRALDLRCPVRVVSDCEVAFAAGTAAADGTVLIAGTGAIAARVERHRLVATIGGHGWLLGDEGSAFWLGREAVRALLRALDRGEPVGELGRAVRAELLGTGPDDADALRKQLIAAVNGRAPIALAELAPLVTAASGTDADARDIVARAAAVLADTAAGARRPGEERAPIVLAGGLTADGNPVGAALRAELLRRAGSPAPELHAAGPGAAGAAWLAALDLTGDEPARYPGI
ncbi:ATPase [Saccharopolyspora sp. HNM0986]|uniref:N-acetylglucosamine kinase n=1 Tax=Saccharopolyspora galaxeae TaxID=2781241 RepID=UPI00190D5474|nr:BadF/BadG/BcrA/BcrD ATPase family protein [Saccharopolyspora sp. HNM0986]MBK0865665.1 ATPase [Saccharopolyspora sp. HNM0986]